MSALCAIAAVHGENDREATASIRTRNAVERLRWLRFDRSTWREYRLTLANIESERAASRAYALTERGVFCWPILNHECAS